jgi:signal transduction histidine kinase/DNA-binding response OmpR family regulator/CHASE3 domain sensor protein
MKSNAVDTVVFKRILQRNITIPLLTCVLLCGVFIGLVVNLMNANKWVDHTDRVIGQAGEILKLIIDSETSYRGYLINGETSYLGPHKIAVEQLDERFKDLKKLVTDNPLQVSQLDVMLGKYEEWHTYVENAILNRPATMSSILNDGHTLNREVMDSIRDEFKKFIDVEVDLRAERSEETKSQSIVLLIVTVSVSLVGGVFLALSGKKQLLMLSESYDEALRKQNEQNIELTQQAWLRSGQAELSNRIQGELSIKEMGEAALEFISKYIDSTIGTLFIVDGGKLVRISTHSFSEDSSPGSKKSYELGEGLVGDVAKQKTLLKVSDLPPDYLKISSGLGVASPRSVVLAPLLSEGTIQGVVELGFLNDVSSESMKFLENISEILGTGVKSALYRTRLQQLLEETQTQSEELQAQQEELRVSNEELTERSQALIKTQTRLENQHAELEQTTSELEEQRQALDQQNKSLKEVQVTLEKKSSELEEASRYKSEFLANMSHELRTPLNSTLILSKLLKDNKKGNLTDEQVEFADTIYSAGNDLLTLINDILDLSKVEAGKLEILREAFSLESLVHSIRGMFTTVAQEKKIKFEVTIASDVPAVIETDRQRLEQIIKNLISNAIKFTNKGSVKLEIAMNNSQEVSFKVIDTGIGIAAEQLGVIFEAFRQEDGTTNRKYGGTGLGLTISRNLSKLLGGHIYVQSKKDEGSTFTLILPVHGGIKVETPIKKEAQPTVTLIPDIVLPDVHDDFGKLPSPGRKILLVVEDDVPFAKVLMNMAHENDFLCLIAQTTSRGYELAVEHRPDAIILDMKLPDAMGLTLLDKLKENSKTRHIPVHAISALDFSKEALRMGAIGFLLKPTELEKIKGALDKLKDKIQQKTKQILIVEDDSKQRKAIVKMIEDSGVNITATGLGREALTLMTERQYDCVIMDLSLPDISGLDLLQELSSKKDAHYSPIIIYTGRSLSQTEEEKLKQYSETIIIKGARSPERLLSEVALFLHQIESQMSEEKQKILKVIRSREKSFEGRKILVADDDARNIFALMSLLESKGASIIVARNGKEALEKLNENPDTDLVLMDIMMPEMDGFKAIQEIRLMPEMKKIPIIAVTAKAMKDDYEKCIEAGANDYLAKPVNVDKLISLMRVWIPMS